MSCPNINLKEYKALIKEYGSGRALAAWQMNGQSIPTIEQAKKLLDKPLVSDIQDENIVDLSNIKDFGERYTAITTKKQELENQGAIISKLGANGFHWIIPTRDTYYQLTNKNDVKNELQDIITGRVQKGSGSLIQKALGYYRTGKGTGRENQQTIPVQQGETFTEFARRELFYKKGVELFVQGGNELIPATKYAIDNNLPVFIDKGAEAHVYLDKERNKVIKYNNGVFYGDRWEEYFESLLFHNYFFPATAYDFKGFIEGDGRLFAVVEQDYIATDNTSVATVEEIGNKLSSIGFERMGEGEKAKTSYFNKDLGIAITDLHDRNVLEREGRLFFIDTVFAAYNSFYKETKEPVQDKRPVDKKLTTTLKNFVKLLEGEVREVDEIIVNGKVISANAATEILSRTIEVVEGKANRDTLPEEVGHLFVEYLPEGSYLLSQMMDDIRNRPLYDEVMEQYKDNEHYQNPDGTVNEDKIAKEAIGKMLARTINEQWDSIGEETLWNKFWDRLWKWIQKIVGIYKENENTAYEQIAEDILTGDTSNIDTDKVTRNENNKKLKNELQSIISKAVSGQNKGDNISAALQYIGRSQKAGTGFEDARSNSEELWREIQDRGHRYTGFKLNSETKLEQGSEHIVYLDPLDDTKVVKIRFSLDPSQIDRYLRELLVYNHLFPNTPYKLLGFDKITTEQDPGMYKGNIAAIVEQPYIKKNSGYDYNTIIKELSNYGLSEVEQYKFENATVGIIVEDLMPRNVIFRNKEPFFIDPIITVSDDILYPKPTGLKSRTNKIQEATNKGEYYFELHPKQVKQVNKRLEQANELQQVIVNDVYLDPHNRIVLERDEHVYRDLKLDNPTIYKSTTQAVGGTKDFGDPNPYEVNTAWGKDFDTLLEAAVNGENLESMNTEIWQEHGVEMSKPREWTIPEEIRTEALNYFRGLISGLTADGSIALTQIIVADEQSKTAGSIDLLLIDSYGNMKIVDLKTSWHSIHSPQYNKLYEVGEGSVFANKVRNKDGQIVERNTDVNGNPIKEPGDKDLKFSKKQLQSMQVGTYSKLVYLKGYPVRELRTVHILLDRVEDETHLSGYRITGWRVDNKNSAGSSSVVHESYTNTEQHKLSENAPLIDIVVPTVYNGKDKLHELNEQYKTGNPLHREAFNNSPEAQQVREERSEELTKRVESAVKTLIDWRSYLTSIKKSTAFEVSVNAVKNVDELRAMIQDESRDTGDYSRIFTIFLTKVEHHVDSMMNRADIKNIKDNNYISNILNAREYINRFEDLIYIDPKKLDVTAAQQSLSDRVVQKMHRLGIAINEGVRESIIRLVSDRTANPKLQDIDAIRTAVTGIREDISNATKFLDTIGNSGVTEFEVLSRLLADKREEIRENSEKISKSIQEAGNELQVAMNTTDPKELYSWMVKDGKVISTRGDVYKEIDKTTTEALYNTEGTLMQPIKEPATFADYEHNKKLYYLREDRTKFTRAEYTEVEYFTGEVSAYDGDYHKLTDKFKRERKEFIRQDSSKNGEWVPIDPSDKKWQEWAGKNLNWIPYTGFVTEWNKELKKSFPTGETEERAGWFPLPHNIEVREYSSKRTGSKSMWDDTYKKIMIGNTPIEKAQKRFYDTYIDILKTEIQKLPAEAMYWFEQGNIPVITANFLKQLANKDLKTGSLVLKELRDFFSVTSTVQPTDETKRMALPLFYMNSLQSQFKIDNLKKLLEDHSKKKLTATNQREWLTEQKRLTGLLKEETDRPTAQQLDPDLIKGLTTFVEMAEHFATMSEVEDTVLAVKEHIIGQSFKQGKTLVTGAQSRALELYNHMLETCFYNDPGFTESTVQKLSSKLMRFTSAVSIPANLFGMANNKFIARINNRIEAFGDSLFKHIAYNRAIFRYNTEHIPGYIKSWGEYAGHSKIPGRGYERRKPGSKYEALVHHFNMVRHLKSGEGRVDLIAKYGGYMGYEAGEWEAQSLIGIAIIDSIYMLETATGKTVSVYDAFQFNDQTGELTLPAGYVYVDKSGKPAENQKSAQHDITNRIHETNDRIHGNYDPANKIMLERTLVGKMMLQFHKWVYPAIKSRYRPGKFDENLGGGVDIEGRYNTLWNFMTDYLKLGNAQDRWSELTDFQKGNMKKDLADAVYLASLFCFIHIVTQAAKGIGDDDPYVKKIKNWLLYQSDRGFKEVSIFVPGIGLLESYQLVNQPFAAMNSVRSFALLIKDMSALPFRDDTHNIYQRGNYKGDYKVYVDMLRLAPGGTTIKNLINLESVKSFYVGNK